MKKGWEEKKLGEVCIVERGSSPRPIKDYITDGSIGVNWIKIGDTKGIEKYIYTTKEKITEAGAKKSRLVSEGDFILTNSMSFGNPYIMKTSGYIHDGWFVLRLQNLIDTEYLYYLLVSPIVQTQFNNLASGAIVKNISSDLVKKVILPIPPISEQQRIVAILDEAFDAIARAKENAEKNLQNARELFESYLQGVFANQGYGWGRISVEDVCESIIDCVNKTAPTVEGPTPFKMIRTTNIRDGKVNLNSVNYVTEDVFKIWTRRQLPMRGDVILTREAPLGEVGMLLTDDKVFLGQRLVCYRADVSKLDSCFLLYAFQSVDLQRQIQALASGSTVQHMRVPDSKKLQLNLPPLTEQHFIVAKLDELSTETKKLEAIYEQKLANLEELKQSILEKAFNGELTGGES